MFLRVQKEYSLNIQHDKYGAKASGRPDSFINNCGGSDVCNTIILLGFIFFSRVNFSTLFYFQSSCIVYTFTYLSGARNLTEDLE